MYISLKELNKLNYMKTELMQVKEQKYWQFKNV